jgi:hypothetical protein
VRLVDRDASATEFDKMIHTAVVLTPEEWAAEKSAFYYSEIKKNPGAVQVKLADIGDNLQPWRLAYLPSETQERLRTKYAKAIKLLS